MLKNKTQTSPGHLTESNQSESPVQSAAETLENASILSSGSSQEGHRLWIGNIDAKITEYHLVKLLEKFGTVKQFDFLFHKSGPLEGQPRGYCFVNFQTKEEAERAIQCLNGKLALSKKLVVRWAHAQVTVFSSLTGIKLKLTDPNPDRFEPFRGDKNSFASLEPSCSEIEEQPSSLSVGAKIKAIEAKLQMMEENVEEEYAGPSPYLYNKPPEKKERRSQPYNKPFRRFRR